MPGRAPRLQPVRVTRRGWLVLGLALALYFAANQTQVNWLYVFAALGAGLWLAAWGRPGRHLAALSVHRRLGAGETEPEARVGATVSVTLTVHNAGRGPAPQVRGQETCPFAPPANRIQTFFVEVPGRGSVTLEYTVLCARRGWHPFPPVALATRAPFGFFAAARAAEAPGGLLVFPEYRELEHFPLLDRRPAVQNPYARVGPGSEFLGVREYRPGDPPRAVHWPTSARAGRLVVREFAEETQPGLVIALDARASAVIGGDDDNTLERAIRIAATLVQYAHRQNLSVEIAADSRAWPAPVGPLSRWAALSYLARLAGDSQRPFADTLQTLGRAAFVAACLPCPDEAVLPALAGLRAQGAQVLAVLIDPAPLAPEWAGRAERLAAGLRAAGVSVRVIGAEPDWERTLVLEDRAAARW